MVLPGEVHGYIRLPNQRADRAIKLLAATETSEARDLAVEMFILRRLGRSNQGGFKEGTTSGITISAVAELLNVSRSCASKVRDRVASGMSLHLVDDGVFRFENRKTTEALQEAGQEAAEEAPTYLKTDNLIDVQEAGQEAGQEADQEAATCVKPSGIAGSKGPQEYKSTRVIKKDTTAVVEVTDLSGQAKENSKDSVPNEAPATNQQLTPGQVGGFWNRTMKAAGQESYCIPGSKIPTEDLSTLRQLLNNPDYSDSILDAIRYLGTATWWTDKEKYPRFGFTAVLKAAKVVEYASDFRSRSDQRAKTPATTSRRAAAVTPPPTPAVNPPEPLSDLQAAAWDQILATASSLPTGRIKPKPDRALFVETVKTTSADILAARWKHTVAAASEPRYVPGFSRWIEDGTHVIPCPGQPGYVAPKAKGGGLRSADAAAYLALSAEKTAREQAAAGSTPAPPKRTTASLLGARP